MISSVGQGGSRLEYWVPSPAEEYPCRGGTKPKSVSREEPVVLVAVSVGAVIVVVVLAAIAFFVVVSMLRRRRT